MDLAGAAVLVDRFIIVFLKIIHRPVFLCKTAFQGLDFVTVFRQICIHLGPINIVSPYFMKHLF
jgi:hypothetical protein